MIISRPIHIAVSGIVSLAAQPFLKQHGCLGLACRQGSGPLGWPLLHKHEVAASAGLQGLAR